ncbi:leptin-like [Clinocottus analis]|uniref:leptin-like n=1 Tax=Clinocottus analis TaxID=304258 RepID=UPI0035BEF323
MFKQVRYKYILKGRITCNLFLLGIPILNLVYPEKKNMDLTLAFLLSLLHILNVCSAAPLPAEVVKMKSKVKWMAELLVVRLNKDFQVPAGLTLGPPADELDGLSSIVTDLDGYNSLICDTFNGVSQVKFDISSLTGYLDQWRQGHCSEQSPKPSVPGPMQELQRRKESIHTVSIEALMRVKVILSLLLRNLDHLQTC